MTRLKLILKNETHYDNRSLKRLFIAGIKRNGLKLQLNKYYAEIKYSRGSISGRATLAGNFCSGNWMLLRLPRDLIQTRLLSYVLDHEFGHNLGLRHREMKNMTSDHEDWAAAYPLKITILKEKPHENRIEKRHKSIEKRLKSWMTKLKRAQTAIKKLTAQQRRMEKVRISARTFPITTMKEEQK